LDNKKGVSKVNMNHRSFGTRFGVCGLVGLSSLAGFYGCSSSSSPTTVTPGETNDSGGEPDSTTVTPEPDGGTTPVTTPDGGDGGGSALILQKVVQTNLFADTADAAANVDPNLVNAWGLAFNPSGVAWISDNGTGLATLYKTNQPTPVGLVVQVPLPDGGGGAIYPAPDAGNSAPSGQIFNPSAAVVDAGTTNDFLGDLFIISAEDGTISGWQSTDGTKAALRVDLSSAGAVFKGLQIIPSTPPVLLAADFHNGKIDAFDTNYAPIAVDGGAAKWVDSTVPAGYAPFNIYATTTNVFVAYAKQDGEAHDDTAGAGNGAVSEFDLTGTLVKSLIPQAATGALNSPWGITVVPAGGWGQLPAGALLVGNFGDGAIHAFNASSGALLGTLTSGGTPLLIDGLWALAWGPSSPQAAEAGALPTQLYFTAGPNMEANGLYGYLTVTP
jgi:uncharacterized protein (TIGR03118 family)